MGDWQLDLYHTQVEFSAKHLGMMTVRGLFTDLNAKAHIEPDHPESSWVELTIDASSVRTHNATRDNDLRSPNFLDTEKFPTITFKSTKVEPISDERFTLTGDLTIKGITRPVSLEVMKYGEFNDERMGHRIAYSATGRINRKDFGLHVDFVLDNRLVVGEEVTISIEGELLEQKETASAGTG